MMMRRVEVVPDSEHGWRMKPDTLGRDREVRAILDGLSGQPGQFAAVMVEGLAGMGQTTLLKAVSAQFVSRNPGAAVLSAGPLESERDLTFSTLGDLFDGIGPDALHGLPAVQRSALQAALLLETDAPTPAQNPGGIRVVGVALRTVLTNMAQDRTVLIVIDDLQWVDPSSLAALRFALHRLGKADLAVLVSQRLDSDSDMPDPLELDGMQPTVIQLGPMDREAVFALIQKRLGLTLPVPSLTWVMDRSGGNPMYALELARALGDASLQTAEDLLPDSLSGLVEARLAGTPPEWGDTLLTLALSRQISMRQLAEIVPEAWHVVVEARQAGLLEWHKDNVRFTHPLLASAVVRRAVPPTRQATHKRLAAVTQDPEIRAHHLALAATGPDEAVAAALVEGATLAAKRGAYAQASELLSLARSSAPPNNPDQAVELALQQVDYLERAGDADASVALLEEIMDQAQDDTIRARVIELYVRSALAITGILSREAMGAMLDEALTLTGDTQLRARIYLTRGTLASAFDLGAALADTETALQLLNAVDDPDPHLSTETTLGMILFRFVRDGLYDQALVDRALAAELEHTPRYVALRCGLHLGRIMKDCGRLAEARVLLLDVYRDAVNEGAYEALAFTVHNLPWVELWSGHPEQAEMWAREQISWAEQTGRPLQLIQGLANLAEVLIWVDRLDEAAEALTRAEELAVTFEPYWVAQRLAERRGLLALARGDEEAAIDAFRQAAAVASSAGWSLPTRTDANLAELLINRRGLAEAGQVIDRLESAARRIGNHALTGAALTAQAMLAGAEQRPDEAIDLMAEAYAELEQGEEPFMVARAKLTEARLRRLRGERNAAVEAYSAAEALFAQVGAVAYVSTAAKERAQVPSRRISTGLTETESQIAALVARGLSNAEIAEDRFITIKTVETHLTRIYAKLGVRSRAQLTRQLATPEG